jgi:small subunit ribosomal protein S16
MTRTGAKNDVCYRVVAADSESPRDGRFLEILGWYDPKLEGVNFNLKMDRIEHWIEKGVQVSDTVRSLIRKADSLPEVKPAPVEEPAAPVAEEEPTAPVAEEEPAAPVAEEEPAAVLPEAEPAG